MGRIHVDFDNNIPRYSCSFCLHCKSIAGKSLCKIKNRGCCWYYPKFTLYNLHLMSKSLEGLQALNTIRTHPNTLIYKYYIHVKGYFDNDGFEDFISNRQINNITFRDNTIFFRACPFVKDNLGCLLPTRYRSHICNFFICDELAEVALKSKAFDQYILARASYSKFIEWENASLENILEESGLNLQKNLDSCIELLQDLPLNQYEFPTLEPIDLPDAWDKQA